MHIETFKAKKINARRVALIFLSCTREDAALVIVSDTSALSALAKMGWLKWLRLSWDRVAVPEAGWRELKAIGDESSCQRLSDAQSEGWLTIHSVADRKAVESLAEHLDA